MIHLPQQSKEGGFVALITAIIFSVILLAMTISLNQAGFFARSALADNEYKERSIALAEACADSAILKIAVGATALPAETIFVGDDTCTINSVGTAVSGIYTITTKATFQKSVTKLEVKIDSIAPFAVNSWKEAP